MVSKKDLVNLEGLFMLYAVKINDGKVMAARRMNTSIDTLNKYLEILERELGFQLIAVNDRRCALTEYGEKLFVLAEKVVDCLKSAYEMRERENAVKGEVRVACDRIVKYNLQGGYLDSFLDKYSDISLSVDTFDTVANRDKKDYDVGLSYDFPKDDDLVVLTTKEIACGFFASNNYLQKHSVPQNLADILQKHRLILKREWLDKYGNDIKDLDNNTQSICLSNSNFVVNEMVTAGGGIGILPKSFAKQNYELICLDDIICPFNSKVYLFARKEVKDVPRIRAVIDYYKQVLAAM